MKGERGDKYEFDSLEDIIESQGEESTYEDEYVYGDSDEIDYNKISYDMDYEFEDDYDEDYEDEYNVYGDWEDGESKEGSEESEEITLGQRMVSVIDRSMDFVESKRFTQIQVVIAIGVMLFIGGITYLILQAGGNVASNVDIQETSVKYVAQETAPEEYENQTLREEEKAEIDAKQEGYINRNKEKYDQAVGEDGVPEGHVALQDETGEVEIITQEEYDKRLANETAQRDDYDTDEDTSDSIEIRPAHRYVWEAIAYGDINKPEVDVYQTKGEFIYFAQNVLANLYPNNVLESDYDPDTHELDVLLRQDPHFELDKDFEKRLYFAYKNSGYQAEEPDALKVNYEEIPMQEYLDSLE